MGGLVVIALAVCAIAYVAGWSGGKSSKVRLAEGEQLQEVTRRQSELDARSSAWREEHARLMAETGSLRDALQRGFLEGRSWLANAFAEYLSTKDDEVACSLVLKPNPAFKASDVVGELKHMRAGMARELKLLQYQLASYEEYFPALVEYREAILDEVVDLRGEATQALQEVDPALALGYLSKDEYDALPPVEKFQRALDRYWSRPKNNVQIGRMYERYVGYLYERDGWTVVFHGALKGFEDFGRDLICVRDGKTEIVQCKCWSGSKVIREKHIMQLFGTCVLYRLTECRPSTLPVFATTTALSPEAEMVARELGIEVRHEALGRYPMVKCNVSQATGERIYHLPFDQQYDRVIIGNRPGEFYAETVAEAEEAGFRRAHRWVGAQAD